MQVGLECLTACFWWGGSGERAELCRLAGGAIGGVY